MHFRSLPIVEHDSVYVRPLSVSDMSAWASYLNNPAVYEHTSWNHPTIEDLSRYLGNETSDEPDSRLRLAIASKDGDELVGTIGFHSVAPVNKSAELAYDLNPEFWGKGIATAVGNVLVGWAHQHVGLVRVQATVLESNLRSIRTIERMGFAQEGLLKSYRHVRGTPRNFFMYARLAGSGNCT
ncbi:GNAT family protein [Pelomonas sp. UHG3]|uniref:GNAT family protein n=1 Tax=Roseateles hydrophilus TaxID=2975054 RepID=A0ACC6C9L4_9BURK|nr:GNAT family protein [Pelomonas sp. UHG3]MCY4745090.1 GNAT family protein [Pelomonas sp. UHG3]